MAVALPDDEVGAGANGADGEPESLCGPLPSEYISAQPCVSWRRMRSCDPSKMLTTAACRHPSYLRHAVPCTQFRHRGCRCRPWCGG